MFYPRHCCMVQRAEVRGTVRMMKSCTHAVLKETVVNSTKIWGQGLKNVTKEVGFSKSVPSGTFQRPKMSSLDASFWVGNKTTPPEVVYWFSERESSHHKHKHFAFGMPHFLTAIRNQCLGVFWGVVRFCCVRGGEEVHCKAPFPQGGEREG